MTIHYSDETVTIHHGDCLDILRELPAASVDAVVTDPPYSLRFMNRDWDAHATPTEFQAWCQQWATECFRVLKPGGHLLAFGGTRTYHRLICGIEDAGFEIRDSITSFGGSIAGPFATLTWVHGQGFPKSLDVGKAIDKANGKHDRDLSVFGAYIRERRQAKGWSLRQLDEAMGTNTAASWWEGRKSGVQPPGVAMYARLKDVLGMSDMFDELVEWCEAQREVIGAQSVPVGHAFAGSTYGGDSANRIADITAPATDAARRWDGWGTALKPASEPIVVARKPLAAGTVAGNVLAHGTGALNIDACRVATPDDLGRSRSTALGMMNDDGWQPSQQVSESNPAGRWPANVVLSHGEDCGERCVPGCAVAELDAQSGELASGRLDRSRIAAPNAIYGAAPAVREGVYQPDSGGASRFFPTFRYEAKAATSERPVVLVSACDCETIKPWSEDTSQPRDIADLGSADGTSWGTSTPGSRTTAEPFPTDTTSITSTETNATTTSGTSNLSPNLSTSESIPDANCVMANGGSPAESVTNLSRSPLSTGTSAPRDGRSMDGADPAISTKSSMTSACVVCGTPKRREAHATVKPLDLLKFLVRLVTPPGGVVLDPFLGSGTTAEACQAEGFRCIGIEREAEYLPLIVQRLTKRADPVRHLADKGDDLGLLGLLDGEAS